MCQPSRRRTKKKQLHLDKVGRIVFAGGILIMWWWVVTHIVGKQLQGISAMLILGSILGAVYFVNHLFYQQPKRSYKRR